MVPVTWAVLGQRLERSPGGVGPSLSIPRTDRDAVTGARQAERQAEPFGSRASDDRDVHEGEAYPSVSRGRRRSRRPRGSGTRSIAATRPAARPDRSR